MLQSSVLVFDPLLLLSLPSFFFFHRYLHHHLSAFAFGARVRVPLNGPSEMVHGRAAGLFRRAVPDNRLRLVCSIGPTFNMTIEGADK